MKKINIILSLAFLVSGCTSLTYHERTELRKLKVQGITVETPRSAWEAPAKPWAAAALNLLPGGGNFYLASGNGGDGSHWLYGGLNLITWPLSVLWGVPEAAIDAGTINQRDLLYYYQYDKEIIESHRAPAAVPAGS